MKKWSKAKKEHDLLSKNRSEPTPFIDRVNDSIESLEVCYVRSSNHCEEILDDISKSAANIPWRNYSWDYANTAFYTCVAGWAIYWANKKRMYLLTGEVNVDDYDLVLAHFDKYKNNLDKMPNKKEAIEGWNERIARKPLFHEMKHICVDPYLILPITNDND